MTTSTARADEAVLAVRAQAGALWPPRRPPRAVLFDRDGTLVVDVPYNGDPLLVELLPGAAGGVEAARRAGLRVGLVTNQSAVARGLITLADVEAVHARLATLVGSFDVVEACPHDDGDRCGCRKPSPGLVVRAAEHLGLDPAECVVVGDTIVDLGAALAAGAAAILVPNASTRQHEIAVAPAVAHGVAAAVDLVLASLG